MALGLVLNGQAVEIAELAESVSLAEVVGALQLKADRIAVEHNGTIAPRRTWTEVRISPGDRLEVVHFVGGGAPEERLDVGLLSEAPSPDLWCG